MTSIQARPLEVAAQWRRTSLATAPADRAGAEQGVRAAYRAAGLAQPTAVLWFDSPLQAAAAALLLGGGAEEVRAGPGGEAAEPLLDQAAIRLAAAGVRAGGASVREAVRTRPWEQSRRRVVEQVGAGGWAELWALTGGELRPQTQALSARIRTALVDRLTSSAELADDADGDLRERTARAVSAVRLALLDAVLGQHDAPWLAAFDAAGELDGLDGLGGPAEVARSAGWWWPYEQVVLLSERPTELHRDEAGRLDRADGPALAYADGFALHAWRGMPVPPDFLTGLAGLTAERIREEENAELRRVMVEYYGYDRYLADSGAEPLHRDETGILWRIQLPDDEPVVVVEVVNSTAEPDGTFRTYWLRVPPGTRTARAGVAWTFGVTEVDYHPQRET
ncbi:hypothetical protein GCM10010193_21210 [Kitasatospora atroaurantiaca]|uniref:DUF6745 domain-containing protein n=1 Tax=Kitasatospora atroaurantiaca TaxID=285545 RepID=A0A561EV56_9ACTN|nr:hypothetical protein [Kitasatospora atroaurantiaca]TWE19487.1 hypothetical protein FB465_4604 [Kitasatospora atroaurantiaca]